MKIALLNCKKAGEVCAGASCMKAFNEKRSFFQIYEGTETIMTAFCRCNGCEAGLNEGFKEKLDRIISEGTQVCHFGVCTIREKTKEECPVITKAGEYLEDHGVKLVRGTH